MGLGPGSHCKAQMNKQDGNQSASASTSLEGGDFGEGQAPKLGKCVWGVGSVGEGRGVTLLPERTAREPELD